MIKFPLYQMRKYTKIWSDKGIKWIQTERSRYVLDLLDTEYPCYSDRRLEILRRELTIYPLNKRIENFSQLINSKARNFIDCEGKIVKWKPEKFYNIEPFRVEAQWTNEKGQLVLHVEGRYFEVPYKNNIRYVRLVNMNGRKYLYDATEDKQPTIRRKL